MHFVKAPSPTLSLLLLLFISLSSLTTFKAQTIIYVDSANNVRNADGTMNNPFPTLQKGLARLTQYLQSTTTARTTSFTLMIAASGEDYEIETTNYQIANFAGTITITSGSSVTSPASVSDCEKLASINFGSGGLTFSGVTNLYFSKINFVEVRQSIKVSEGSLFQFTDSCVQDQVGHSQDFFKTYNVTQFLFRDSLIFGQLNGEFMTYIHQKIDGSKATEVNKLAEISNNIIVLTSNSQPSKTTSFLNFESSGSGQFLWNNNTIQGETLVYLGTPLLTVTAFKDTTINNLKIAKQNITFTTYPLVNINSSPNVTLDSWELSGNTINLSPSVQFVLSTDNANLTVNNLNYNFNNVSASSNSSAVLQFLSVNQIDNMFLNNHTVDNNRFLSSFVFFTQPPTNHTGCNITITNITFTSNFNPAENAESTATFTYLSQVKLVLASLSVTELAYSNNTMAGSLFQLSLSAHNYLIPVFLYFGRSSIVNNANAVDFCFVEVVNNNPYGSKPMYHHDFEYYYLRLVQLNVQNNTLLKGDDKVSFYHIGFIQSFGAQVIIQGSTIVNNTFRNYDVVDMISQMSSAFIMNSEIANNTFNNSALINTEYGVLQVYGDYYSFLTGIRIVYRYAMVVNSRFNNLTLINSTLFTLNNPYLIMRGNTFNNITFNNSNMLVGANFAPPGATLGVSNYIRNATAELLTLRAVPLLRALFTTGLKTIKSLTGDDTVYFYSIELNTFKNLTFYNGGLISFTKYSFKGSIVSLNNNTFMDIQLMDDTNYLVQTNGPYLFAFTRNFMINIKGFGSQLNLDSMSESKGCYILNNTVDGVNGPGVIKGKGSGLHDFNISNNNFTNNVFKASVIDISVTSIYGEFSYYENIFENNSLILRNDTFFQSYNFIMLTAQISYTQSPISLYSSLFNNITVVENPNSIKYSYVYGVMTFFVANSSIVLKNLNFTQIDFQGQEITLIYASSSGFQLSDSIISGCKADNTYGFLTLYSHNLYISGNLFNNMVNTREYGYGIVYLPGAPDQTFYINVTLVENNFTACSASQGALVGTEVNTLNLTILNTTIIGSSEYIGAFTLKNTTCFGCNITDMDIIVNGVSGYTNDTFFYFTQVIGQIAISDINLNLKYDITKIPSYYREYLFLIDQSPQLFIDIYDIRMTSETSWAPWIQFINMTTAQVTFRDSVIANLTSWQSFIQIEGPTSFGKSTFNMTNVTVSNMTFRAKITDQEIGFLFYNNSNSADSSLVSSADTLVQDSHFLNVDGGVIVSYFAPMKYNINVTNCYFINNTDNEGTALFYHLNSRASESTLYVDKCYFYNNTATTVGGVMSFYSLNFKITNSQFVNNSAVKNGGALFVLGKRPANLLSDNIFLNNTSPHQKDIGIAPETLYITTNFSKDLGIYESKTLPTTRVNTDSISPEVLKELQFFVIDASTYAFTSAKIILVLQDNEENQAFDFSKQSLSITFQNQGISYSTDCNFTTCILRDFSVSFVGNEGDIIPVEVSYSSEAFQIPVKKFGLVLRRCVAGEFYNSDNQICERCEVNTYSFLTTEPCKDCVKNAICAGGASVCPNEGYWNDPRNATKIYSCKTDGIYRCKGECNGCVEGYTGPLCQACNFTDGYMETGSFQCSTCKSPFLSLAISLGISLAFMGIVIFGAYSTYETNSSFFFNTDYKQTKQQIKRSYFLRLLSRYIQIFSFIYYSSTYFQSLVGQASRLGQTVSRTITYASQCSLIAIGLEPDQYIYVITALNIMIPFCELFILFILSIILFKRKIINSKYKFMLTAIISVVTWHQATLVGFMSDKMSCSTLYKGSDASYLSLHPNWRCDESPYPEFKTNLIIPNLAFWALIIPLILTLVFIINRKNLDEQTFGTALGGLYDHLKREYFFWGVIQMVVDVTLGMCTYLLAQNPEIRVFVTVIILWVYQMLVRWFTPYKLPYLNRIEITAINVCILNILLMYSLVDSKYDILRYTAITLIISTNFSVFALLLLRLGRLFIPDWLYLLLRSLFRIGKGRASVTPVNTAEEDLMQMRSESEAELTRFQVEATIKARVRGSTATSQAAAVKPRNESLKPDNFLKKPSFEMTRSVTHANVVIRRSSSGTVL